jgi:hypothetical protein
LSAIAAEGLIPSQQSLSDFLGPKKINGATVKQATEAARA